MIVIGLEGVKDSPSVGVKESPSERVKDSPSEGLQLGIWIEIRMRQKHQLWGYLLDVQGGGKAGKGQ